MRLLSVVALCCFAAQAQVPAQDARNVNLQSTDTHFTAKPYKSLAEWQARREVLKRQILNATGLFPMFPKNDLHQQVFGRIAHPDYSIEKVLIETLPGYYLGGNLYRPLKPAPAGGYPAVVSPHGHWAYGRLENTNICSVPARAIMLARLGFVVFTIDMVGYNDTIQTPHDFGTKPEEQAWSFGSLGLQMWNAVRAVDFLQSLPDVNRQKIGATGASGGATQTFLLAAIDDRIQFSAPANMVSFTMQGGGICENAPGLRVDANNVEFAAMMAPRPMIMAGATGDWTRNMKTEEYPAVRAIYDLYGKGDDVAYFFQDAPHNYNQPNREAMYAFFGTHVLGLAPTTNFKESRIGVDKPEDQLVLHNRRLPDNAVTYRQLFEEWVGMAKQQTGNERERLAAALAAEWPDHVIGEGTGDHIVLGRPGRGDRIPAIFIKGSNPPLVLVHPDGAEAARKSPEAAKALQAGRALLAIDAFQTGSAVAPRDRTVRMFLTFNKTDDANRVQDILTALAWLNVPKASLTGIGKAGVWCTYAAAVGGPRVQLEGRAEENADFSVPGLERAGGLKAARSLAGIH